MGFVARFWWSPRVGNILCWHSSSPLIQGNLGSSGPEGLCHQFYWMFWDVCWTSEPSSTSHIKYSATKFTQSEVSLLADYLTGQRGARYIILLFHLPKYNTSFKHLIKFCFQILPTLSRESPGSVPSITVSYSAKFPAYSLLWQPDCKACCRLPFHKLRHNIILSNW